MPSTISVRVDDAMNDVVLSVTVSPASVFIDASTSSDAIDDAIGVTVDADVISEDSISASVSTAAVDAVVCEFAVVFNCAVSSAITVLTSDDACDHVVFVNPAACCDSDDSAANMIGAY